jgi:hypothetical protein
MVPVVSVPNSPVLQELAPSLMQVRVDDHLHGVVSELVVGVVQTVL